MVTNNSKALKSIASGIADMEPEAGWHPSHPVVEPMELRRQSQTCLSFAEWQRWNIVQRSWDAFFIRSWKKVAPIFEFFRESVYIMPINILIQKDMATTIKTSSKNYFNKIQKYLHNKRVFFTPSLNLGVYALTVFDLNQDQTNSLISKMTKHFHLTNQQEPLALAA